MKKKLGPENITRSRQTRSFHIGVFSISCCMMMIQVMQSRIISVTSWYHLSFLVISLAMLGITAGALHILKRDENAVRRHSLSIIRKNCFYFACYSLISVIILCIVPLQSELMLLLMVALFIVSYFVGKVYYYAGIVLTVALTRSEYKTSTVYASDLIGAGFGCALVLLLMETMDTPSAMVFVAGMSFFLALWEWGGGEQSRQEPQALVFVIFRTFELKRASLVGVILCILLGGLNLSTQTRSIYPLFIKGSVRPLSHFDTVTWNAISRVTVAKDYGGMFPFFWGASENTPKIFSARYKYLEIDGGAATPITSFNGNLDSLQYLEYDVTNVAYALPRINSAAIIGLGGGRDVLSAKYFGVDKVTALDVNAIQVELLQNTYRKYAGLHTLENVQLLNAEARSWFRSNNQKFDVIQMSLIDTWASTGSGAYALSENGLYTVEAWKNFMHSLSDHGIFTVSRWADDRREEEMGRALSVALQALREMGAQSPGEHVALVESSGVATLIVARNPFESDQLEALGEHVSAKKFKFQLAPRALGERSHTDSLYYRLATANGQNALAEMYEASEFNISPSRDINPFFFNQAKASSLIATFYHAFSNSHVDHFAYGQAKAQASLLIILALSILAVAMTLVFPNLASIRIESRKIKIFGTLYFALIGIGFMLAEISLIQALGVFLGHPHYGLSVVLLGLIVFSGIGSYLSSFLLLTAQWRKYAWAFFTAGYLLILSWYVGAFLETFAVENLLWRALLSLALVFPAGLLLGMAFPTGMAMVEGISPKSTPWMWAVNGAAGVLAGGIALLISMNLGVNITLAVAALCYACVIIPLKYLRR